MGKLTAKKVKHAGPGIHVDGDGLMLVVRAYKPKPGTEPRKDAKGSRKWVLRIKPPGQKRRDIGIGPASLVTLSEARATALEARRAYYQGRDWQAERRAERETVPTFKEAAEKVLAEYKKAWRSEKTATMWWSRLERYVLPKLGNVPVNKVDGPAVRNLLADFWLTRPETARKVRGQIITILDSAHARGWRMDEAPRSISKGLPKQRQQRQHHASLPWREMPGFIADLDKLKCEPLTRYALELMALCAVRTIEIRRARWRHIDFEKSLWVVPAQEMKSNRPHRVPLSPRAVEVLKRVKELRNTDDPGALVFPGRKPGKGLSDRTLAMPLRKAGLPFTPHGLRSSFRTWCSEAADVPREIAEAALAHTIPSETERSYQRGDLLERRTTLMRRWSDFLTTGEMLPQNVSDLDEARRERGAA